MKTLGCLPKLLCLDIPLPQRSLHPIHKGTEMICNSRTQLGFTYRSSEDLSARVSHAPVPSEHALRPSPPGSRRIKREKVWCVPLLVPTVDLL